MIDGPTPTNVQHTSDLSVRPLVTVVIPMLNERAGLDVLAARLKTALAGTSVRWEIVVVDDGSTDGTREVLAHVLGGFEKWKAVILSRNFGQQAAYRAGLEYASGDAVIFLDADLQDPPEMIPKLIEAWQSGNKVVNAVRASRQERGPRRWLFDAFHTLFHRVTRRAMPANSGTFALLDRVIVNHLLKAREVNLFLPALKNWFGYPQATIVYDRQERAVGAPKQSFKKLFAYALNGLLSFSELPLQWIAVAGVFVSVLSFGYAGVLLTIKFAQFFGGMLQFEVKGFTTLAVAMFCLGGVQLLCLGIIGQYLAAMYREMKGRPVYVVERVLSSNES
ncbi:MAG TPA: glycosyltransferase family 2 protein [Methylomirabilota bacterium]|nr:glycosyltransferase family 2 protein [Methylomirabilota bacterium]